MNSRSKTNNLVALLIAAILFAAGFAMYFVHQKLESDKEAGQVQTSENIEAAGAPLVKTALRMDLSARHT